MCDIIGKVFNTCIRPADPKLCMTMLHRTNCQARVLVLISVLRDII